MKNKILVFAFASILFASCTSSKFEIPAGDVPVPVFNSFQQKYPSAEVVEWDAAKEGGSLAYEVCFKANDKKTKAIFRPDGTFIKEK